MMAKKVPAKKKTVKKAAAKAKVPAARKAALKTAPPKPALAAATKPRPSGALATARIDAILRGLDEAYPRAECALVHRSPWELLVATILSAQCTDERVNKVTPELFRRFPTAAAMAAAAIEEIEALIRSTGFFHNKAKSILGSAQKVVANFGGRVPQSMAELTTLPGVARKTASVVLGVCFSKAEGVVVDTHVFRIARRLELATGDTPEKVEQELMRLLPHERWISFSHQIIHHGRQICAARKPACYKCNLEPLCHAEDKSWSS